MKHYCQYLIFVFSFLFVTSVFSQETKITTYFNSTNFSVLKGVGKYNTWWGKKYNNNESIMNVTFVNGVEINKSRLGLGIAFELWGYEYGKYSKATPVFLRYDYTFTKAKPQIFSFVDVGYTFGNKRSDGQDFQFDKLVSIGPGIKFQMGKSTRFAAAIYYKLQQIRNGKHTENKYHRRNYSGCTTNCTNSC